MKVIFATPMRGLVLATVLLATSGLCPAFAQDEGKPPVASQPAPAQSKQDQQTGGDQKKANDREAGRENDMGGMMDRMGRRMDWDHRKAGRDGKMRRDDDDVDRGYRSSDRADRDGYGRDYHDEDRPRRRVKVCFEYDNGDEYCRYR